MDQEEPAEPPRYTRETLPIGDALVCRHGTMWAARLVDGSPEVIVTISGHGTDPDVVRLEPVTDLRPMLAARSEVFARLRDADGGCGLCGAGRARGAGSHCGLSRRAQRLRRSVLRL